MRPIRQFNYSSRAGGLMLPPNPLPYNMSSYLNIGWPLTKFFRCAILYLESWNRLSFKIYKLRIGTNLRM